jgi:hypothetical protein
MLSLHCGDSVNCVGLRNPDSASVESRLRWNATTSKSVYRSFSPRSGLYYNARLLVDLQPRVFAIVIEGTEAGRLLRDRNVIHHRRCPRCRPGGHSGKFTIMRRASGAGQPYCSTVRGYRNVLRV